MELLNPRVSNSNVDDPNKLIICISYLTQTLGIVRIIWGYNLIDLFTWVDVSYAVHPNMLLQTGGVMSMGYGILHCRSSKQNMNAIFLTEDELIGTSEYIIFNLFVVMFLEAQGYEIKNHILFQDNKSTISMAKNGRASCTGNFRHINIRHFFVKGEFNKGEIEVNYCPTHLMTADYFTKPL